MKLRKTSKSKTKRAAKKSPPKKAGPKKAGPIRAKSKKLTAATRMVSFGTKGVPFAPMGTGAASPPDIVLHRCCTGATIFVLAKLKWQGNQDMVKPNQTFADTYGYDDDSMLPFTREVNMQLNLLLRNHGRREVRLPLAQGLTVKASATVQDFVDTIYSQAMEQHP